MGFSQLITEILHLIRWNDMTQQTNCISLKINFLQFWSAQRIWEKASTLYFKNLSNISRTFPICSVIMWWDSYNTISEQCDINIIWSYSRPFRDLTKIWPEVHKHLLLCQILLNFNVSNKNIDKAESPLMFLPFP